MQRRQRLLTAGILAAILVGLTGAVVIWQYMRIPLASLASCVGVFMLCWLPFVIIAAAYSWGRTPHRKQKPKPLITSEDAIEDDAQYMIGDDGEITEIEQPRRKNKR